MKGKARLVGVLMAALLAERAPAQVPLNTGQAQSALFRPLLADPKEPRFFATYLWAHSPRLASRLGSVGFGQTFSLLHGQAWQLGVAAGVFSEFDMQSTTTDLLNTDYLIGLPLTYRRGAWATRLRVFHQSSHLGDEYMVHTHAQRITLSYEAAELLVARSTLHWRVYGGGEYTFTHQPRDLKPVVLHGGAEYRQTRPLLRIGRLAAGRLVAGLDAQSVQDRGWRVGWSGVTGLELADGDDPPEAEWRWSLLLKAYTGPAPYGQFYRDDVSYLGLGVGFTL
ncbi:MAG TPA: DUF1207 domain-containing protein [Gemmatimonadales bacterium]|nr:DUF1207 domain-containing protein [Gemmatimonadales bacterium]